MRRFSYFQAGSPRAVQNTSSPTIGDDTNGSHRSLPMVIVRPRERDKERPSLPQTEWNKGACHEPFVVRLNFYSGWSEVKPSSLTLSCAGAPVLSPLPSSTHEWPREAQSGPAPGGPPSRLGQGQSGDRSDETVGLSTGPPTHLG